MRRGLVLGLKPEQVVFWGALLGVAKGIKGLLDSVGRLSNPVKHLEN